MTWKQMIDEMKKGNEDAITYALNASGMLARVNGIIFATLHQKKNLASKIRELLSDHTTAWGYETCDFATAALDILGVEKYHGDSEKIKRLIESKFDFYKE